MANHTKADLKTRVAIQLGKTNAAVPTPKRDQSIDAALDQYIGEHDWSWNRARVTISDGGSLPATFSALFPPNAYYDSGQGTVPITLVSAYQVPYRSDPVFSVDSGTFETNVTQACVMDHFLVPAQLAASGSDDTGVLPMPDITTVSRLAIADYWYAAERDEVAFDRFTKLYANELLPRDILRDRQAVRATVRPRAVRRNLGWNRVTSR